jgi:hypothetical protein
MGEGEHAVSLTQDFQHELATKRGQVPVGVPSETLTGADGRQIPAPTTGIADVAIEAAALAAKLAPELAKVG